MGLRNSFKKRQDVSKYDSCFKAEVNFNTEHIGYSIEQAIF